MNCAKVALEVLTVFFRWLVVRYFDECFCSVVYARIYKTKIFTLSYLLRKMAVAPVVFIEDSAVFKCMICAWCACVNVLVKYCNVS